MLLHYLPITMEGPFQASLGRCLPAVLDGLSDDSEGVRDAALGAGECSWGCPVDFAGVVGEAQPLGAGRMGRMAPGSLGRCKPALLRPCPSASWQLA